MRLLYEPVVYNLWGGLETHNTVYSQTDSKADRCTQTTLYCLMHPAPKITLQVASERRITRSSEIYFLAVRRLEPTGWVISCEVVESSEWTWFFPASSPKHLVHRGTQSVSLPSESQLAFPARPYSQKFISEGGCFFLLSFRQFPFFLFIYLFELRTIT